MENEKLDEIISLLKSINNKLSHGECEEQKSEEDEFMDFLNEITEELGLSDRVTIKKVVNK